jgi:hypothetical protein
MSNPLVIIIVVLLLLMVLGAPGLGINHGLGYWPSGGLGLVLLIVVIVLLLRG